ncbi:hypothetical protein Hanom_Chr06g00552111 [Helianthus anomalus]
MCILFAVRAQSATSLRRFLNGKRLLTGWLLMKLLMVITLLLRCILRPWKSFSFLEEILF